MVEDVRSLLQGGCGFQPDEVSADSPSPALVEHRQRLLELGRQWQRFHRGPSDLSSLYAAKYKGP